MFDFYKLPEDADFENSLEKISFTGGKGLVEETSAADAGVKHYAVNLPDEQYAFLHEAAIYAFNGVLYAAWYANVRHELTGETPIFYSSSSDCGKHWSKRKLLITDPSAQKLYCPPVFAEDGGKLYMLVNEMTNLPDHIHAMHLYVYDRAADEFRHIGSRPTGFKLNTNAEKLPNGALMLSGRIGEIDHFPNTPAVLISDSGKTEAEWRLVKIRPNGNLPLGRKFIHPEISPMISGGKIYMFCRDDESRVPLVFLSHDGGNSWSKPLAHDLPIINSKIYSGTLSDGRGYILANLYNNETNYRGKLALMLTEKGSPRVDKCIILNKDRDCAAFPQAEAWHYPCACESDGNLYVIYTASTRENARGAVVAVVPLK